MRELHRVRKRSSRQKNLGNSSLLKSRSLALDKGKMVLPFLLCASIFSKEPLGINVSGSRVDLLQWALVIYGFLQIGRAEIAPKVAIFLIALLSTSFLTLTYFEYEINILQKQGIPAVFIFTGICSALERVSMRELLKAYKQVCFYAALFGLVQILLDLGGISLLIKTSGRLDSFSEEPSYYAIATGPALYLMIREKVKTSNLWLMKTGVIVLAFLLTLSVTGLVILIVIAVLLGSQKRGPIYSFLMLGLLFALYVNQDLLPNIVQQKIAALSDSKFGEIASAGATNLSVLSPISNWEVAKDTILSGRLLGNGFGGHQSAYYEYFEGSTFSFNARFGINSIGGHSLFIRSVSEFGLFGLFIYAILILRGFFNAQKSIHIWTTLLAIFLVGRVVKLGGYFELGLPLFVLAPLVFNRWAPGGRRRIIRSSGKKIRAKGGIKKSSLARN